MTDGIIQALVHFLGLDILAKILETVGDNEIV